MNIPRDSRFAAPISVPSSNDDRPLGTILIQRGKLNLDGAARILEQQKKDGSRFGDAAVALGVLDRSDIDSALAEQYDYPCLPEDALTLDPRLVAAYRLNDEHVEALRTLRTTLKIQWFTEPTRRALAITSALPGEGRSILAANLAIIFAQLGERCLLIDADMRHPAQHEYFRLDNKNGLSTVLRTNSIYCASSPIEQLERLHVLTAGPTPPNPQELLCRPAFKALLDAMVHEYDAILVDTPPGTLSADCTAIAVQTKACLVLTRQNKSALRKSMDFGAKLRNSGINVLGAVFNEF